MTDTTTDEVLSDDVALINETGDATDAELGGDWTGADDDTTEED